MRAVVWMAVAALAVGSAAEARSFNTCARAECACKTDTVHDDRRDVKLANECDVKHSFNNGIEVIDVRIAGGPDYRFVRKPDGRIYTDGRGQDHRVAADKDGRVVKFCWQDRGHHYSLRVAVDD